MLDVSPAATQGRQATEAQQADRGRGRQYEAAQGDLDVQGDIGDRGPMRNVRDEVMQWVTGAVVVPVVIDGAEVGGADTVADTATQLERAGEARLAELDPDRGSHMDAQSGDGHDRSVGASRRC